MFRAPVLLRSLPTTALSAPTRSLAASLRPLARSPRQIRQAHAISNPTLANIEKRWEAMPPQEQAELWMALRDRMKVDWHELTIQEKKAGMSIVLSDQLCLTRLSALWPAGYNATRPASLWVTPRIRSSADADALTQHIGLLSVPMALVLWPTQRTPGGLSG